MANALEPANDLPIVSVVVPMLNELGAIEACLDAFEGQTYPLERLDVIVVDGGSSDGSRAYVDDRASRSPWLRVVDNPKRKAAAAFNIGVANAKGEIVMLFSAHGVPASDYVASSVEVLRDTGADGVGGRYLHEGTDRVSRAIGRAMVSPFGMASPHRHATERREVDTISHPAYLTRSIRSIGPFDETLERNSDYELNHRMREAGMVLLFDPSVVSIYRPRPSLQALGRQFWWYGRWKARVVERHPRSLKPRHLVAPVAVVGAVVAPLLCRFRLGRRLVFAAGVGYLGLAVAATVHADPLSHDADPVTLLACFPVMHACWGSGFLLSLLEDAYRGER